MGLISMLIFSQISDARDRKNEQWDIEQARKFGCKSLQEYYDLLRENEERTLFKRKNESWFNSGTKKGFMNVYLYERKWNKRNSDSVPSQSHSFYDKWLDINYLANISWDWKNNSYKNHIEYLSEAISHYYILENKLYEQDLDKKEVTFHIQKIQEDVNEVLKIVINYQEAEKTSKIQKEKIDNEVNIAKQQLETLELQKQIIDS